MVVVGLERGCSVADCLGSGTCEDLTFGGGRSLTNFLRSLADFLSSLECFFSGASEDPATLGGCSLVDFLISLEDFFSGASEDPATLGGFGGFATAGGFSTLTVVGVLVFGAGISTGEVLAAAGGFSLGGAALGIAFDFVFAIEVRSGNL